MCLSINVQEKCTKELCRYINLSTSYKLLIMTKAINTLYFIPGTMCDERLWATTWRELSALSLGNYNLVNLSIPSLKNIDEITKALSEQLPNNSYLIGFSLGGYIASNIALTFPHKVNKLLLIANMSSALPEKETKERTRTIQWIKANGYNGIPEKRIRHLLHPNAHNNMAIIQTINNMDATLGKKVLLHQLNVTTQRKNLLNNLLKIPQPINFLVGDADALVDINKIKDQLNTAKRNNVEGNIQDNTCKNKFIEIVKNTGHMLPLEQPNYLAKTIASWVSETT